jgi:hypothetical protein
VRSRIAQLSMVLIAAIAVTTAPIAAADPADLVPICSGNQTPMNDNCKIADPGTVAESDDFDSGGPGADPNVPLGPQ